jgi:hypothetical protein
LYSVGSGGSGIRWTPLRPPFSAARMVPLEPVGGGTRKMPLDALDRSAVRLRT